MFIKPISARQNPHLGMRNITTLKLKSQVIGYFVGTDGIEPSTSFLREHDCERNLRNALNLCVCKESNLVLLSYQESVLPVNYTRIIFMCQVPT